MSEAEHIIVPVPSSQTTQDGNGSNQTTASASSTRVLDWIAEQVTTNQCILFLGSAIHVPSPSTSKYYYPKEKCPPVGDKLSEILKDQCGYKGEDWRNLQRVSQYFETDSKSRFLLVNAIRNAVQVNKEASPVLHALANLDFPIVITTNYDDLYEQALNVESEKGKPQVSRRLITRCVSTAPTTDPESRPRIVATLPIRPSHSFSKCTATSANQSR